MGANQPPLSPEVNALLAAVQEQQLTIRGLQNELQVAKSHYGELLQYFKHLVWLTGGALTIIVLVGGFIFRSNLQDTLRDIKQNATDVATNEAKNRVNDAFEEKNIKAQIAEAAKDKIGKITDKMIEQQLNSKLQPIQQRILLIGRISECEARIHRGNRPSLEELARIMNETNDSDVRQFARSTLNIVSDGYETFHQNAVKLLSQQGAKPLDILQRELNHPFGPQAGVNPSNLAGVVRVIREDQELDDVAIAIITFREMTGEKNIKMFDFKAVNAWCASHEPQCK